MTTQDYETKGYSKYGSNMGRRSDLPREATGNVTLRYVPLYAGYDSGGAYWGTGIPLFVIANEDGMTFYFRAADFDKARSHVAETFPYVTITQPTTICDSDIAEMAESYLEYVLVNSEDDDGISLWDDYTTADFTTASKAAAHEICRTFAEKHADIFLRCIGNGSCTWALAGRDLLYGRNGAGMGFEDGAWPEREATILKRSAEELTETYAYVVDAEADAGQIALDC